MRFEYGKQGKLFRNLGDGTTITASDVTLVQHYALGTRGLCEGWAMSVGLQLEAPDEEEARKSARRRLDSFLYSLDLVGREEPLQGSPFLRADGLEIFREVGTPGSAIMYAPMLYRSDAITENSLNDLADKIQKVVPAIEGASNTVRLAVHWYSQAISDDSLVDRFVKLWIAFDVLVPLNPPPNEFADFKGRSLRYLRNHYPGKNVDGLLDALYAVRKAVFHEGDHAAISREDSEKTRKLVRNLIYKELGLMHQDVLASGFF